MLSASDVSIANALRVLASFDVDGALFVPTRTALDKGIIDAHASLRSFLSRRLVHDFSRQPQGSEHKVTLPITLISGTNVSSTHITFYRPQTKNGDPRFWISKLNKASEANNLWAVWLQPDGTLVAANFSHPEFERTSQDPQEALGAFLFLNMDKNRNAVADELLEKLIAIHDLGYVPTMRSGDTGVGFTLESLLGIQANSSKNPDYKGIELKAKRPNLSNRVNLFSMVPDWKLSSIKNALDLVNVHGYWDSDRARKALYVTLSSAPNAQGLFLEVDEGQDFIYSSKRQASGRSQPVLTWVLDAVKEALVSKHTETFWVTASQRINASNVEEFLYRNIVHTRAPLVHYIPTLIEASVVTLDLTLHVKANGKTRDHGYLFKIKPDKLDLLFPDPIKYDLSKLSQSHISST